MIDIDQIDVNKTTEIIYKVFNLYNGRINTQIPAILTINWSGYYDDNFRLAGQTISCGTITIYPMVIARNEQEIETFYASIALTIIHELYHVDQKTDPNILNNINYRNYIEAAVEVQSLSFMYTHLNEICNLCGIELTMPISAVNKHIKKFNIGAKYERNTPMEHFKMVINDMTRGEASNTRYCLFSLIDKYYYDKEIIVFINNNGYTINKSMYETQSGVLSFNKFIYDNYLSYDLRRFLLEYEANEYKLIIKFDCDTYHRMVEVIK